MKPFRITTGILCKALTTIVLLLAASSTSLIYGQVDFEARTDIGQSYFDWTGENSRIVRPWRSERPLFIAQSLHVYFKDTASAMRLHLGFGYQLSPYKMQVSRGVDPHASWPFSYDYDRGNIEGTQHSLEPSIGIELRTKNQWFSCQFGIVARMFYLMSGEQNNVYRVYVQDAGIPSDTTYRVSIKFTENFIGVRPSLYLRPSINIPVGKLRVSLGANVIPYHDTWGSFTRRSWWSFSLGVRYSLAADGQE